jgi:hypothetical protein
MDSAVRGQFNKFLAGALLAIVCGTANALQQIDGTITVVEPTYMPSYIQFQMNTGSTICPANTWLKWQKDTDNNKAVYSALIAAVTAGRMISLFINDGDSTCTGQYLHIHNN